MLSGQALTFSNVSSPAVFIILTKLMFGLSGREQEAGLKKGLGLPSKRATT